VDPRAGPYAVAKKENPITALPGIEPRSYNSPFLYEHLQAYKTRLRTNDGVFKHPQQAGDAASKADVHISLCLLV
jgi:hypothetical protein